MGFLALCLLAFAFVAQVLIAAVRALVGRKARSAEVLPLVEVGSLASAWVVSVIAVATSAERLSILVLLASSGLVASFVALQFLRSRLLRRAAEALNDATTSAMAIDVAGRAEASDSDRGEIDDAGGEERQCRPSINIAETPGMVPVLSGPKIAYGYFLPTHVYVLFVNATSEQVNSETTKIMVIADSYGLAFSATNNLILLSRLLSGLATEISLAQIEPFLNNDDPKVTDILRAAIRRTVDGANPIGTEVTLEHARDTAEAIVTCRRDDQGRCRTKVTASVTPAKKRNEFSAAAVINLRPAVLDARPDQFIPGEVEVECKGIAAFNGRLAIKKITIGASIGAEIPGPVKISPSANVEIEIEPQGVDDQTSGGRTFGVRCDQSA